MDITGLTVGMMKNRMTLGRGFLEYMDFGSFVNKLNSNYELMSRAKPPSTQRTTPAELLEKRIGTDAKTLTKH